MFTKIQLLLFFVCFQQICFGQHLGISKTAKDQLYVQTDKDYYLKGETIFYKIYLSDQSRKLGSSESEVVYIDLINEQGQIDQASTIKINDGVGIGSFQLTSSGDGGAHAIRAYTNHMRNFHPRDFFRKLLLVENGSDVGEKQKELPGNPTIFIYPEGGQFVNGIQTNFIIHSTDAQGVPQSIEVELLENDNSLSTLQTNEYGFATASILPNKSSTYSIKSNSTIIEFPESTETTTSIKTTVSEESLHATITSTDNSLNHKLLLVQGENTCLLYTSPSPRDLSTSRMPSSA